MSDEILYKYIKGKGWVVDRAPEPNLLTDMTITFSPGVDLQPGMVVQNSMGQRWRVISYSNGNAIVQYDYE